MGCFFNEYTVIQHFNKFLLIYFFLYTINSIITESLKQMNIQYRMFLLEHVED